MNAYMNINVRVISAAARAQIKALQAQVAGLQKQLAMASATSAGGMFGGASIRGLTNFGNKLQWTGRQLQYNWTLPLLLAGGAAAKWALENEKAMTRVTKVYGDTTDAGAYFNKQLGLAPDNLIGINKATRLFKRETDALAGSFEALSNKYGESQKEVIETAGAWAAAGVSGKALAESTELSIKAAILGDMNLAKSTESLIAIQSQYSLSTQGLNLALAELNAIENSTAISMGGLIDGFAKSAGTAREFGVDVRHLGGMLAALVPATGSATNAGNALKTIMSRILSPTKESADVMKEFGVNTADAAWNSSTAMERLLVLAKHMKDDVKNVGVEGKGAAKAFNEMSDSQRAVVATTLGSRYQVNRFLVLMRELNNEHGNYAKALNATADKEKVFATMDKELQNVLDSNPRRLAILWNTIKNGMADAVQPLIVYILYLVNVLRMGITAFKNMDPAIQKLVLWFLILIGVVGPLLRYLGSSIVLFGYLGKAILGSMFFVLRMVGAKWLLVSVNKVLIATIGMTARALLIMPFALTSRLVMFLAARMVAMGAAMGVAKLASAGLAIYLNVLNKAILLLWTVVKSVFSKTVIFWVASHLKMVATSLAGWAKIAAVWVFGMARLAAITVAGWGWIAVKWVAGLGLLAAGGIYTAIIAPFASMLAGLALMALEGAAAIALGIMRVVPLIVYYTAEIIPAMIALFELMWAGVYAVGTFFSPLLVGVWTGMHIIMADVSLFFSNKMLAIKKWFYVQYVALSAIYGRVLTRITAATGAAETAVMKAWDAVKLAAKNAWSRAMLVIEGAYALASFLLTSTWGGLQTTAQITWDRVKVAAKTAWKNAMLAIEAAYTGAAWIIYNAWGAASVALQTFWDNVKLLAKVAWSMAASAIDAAYTGLAWIIYNAWGAASVALQKFWDGVKIAAKAVYNATALALDKAYTAVALTLYAAYSVAYSALQRTWAMRGLIIQLAYQSASIALAKGWRTAMLLIHMGLFKGLLAIGRFIFAAVMSPWGLAIAAVIGIVYIFRNQIVQIWNNIVGFFSDGNNSMVQGILNAWNALPSGVANALTAVAKVVHDAAMQIYEWFSYINPFAHHSPSLVENVTNGMAAVRKQFASISSIGSHIKGAYADIKKFGKAVAGLTGGASSFEDAQNRAKIKKQAPGALQSYIALSNRLKQLKGDLGQLDAAMKAQQAVVDRWQKKVDLATEAIDRQQKKLDRLSAVQDKWQNKLDAAKDRLSAFASAPIRGMQAMSDAIFDNEMQQKRLRLEMMRLEDATGPLEDVKAKMDAINGAQELLSGKKGDLQAGGAGGDILKAYDDQIAALEDQRKAFDAAAAPLENLQKQMDLLARKGEEMDLTQSLRFDPLTRQIDQVANAMEELPFDQIMAGVQGAQADIAVYTDKLKDATTAVNAQQAVVDAMTRARDRLQARLDRESDKLDKIKDQYDAVASAISDVESVMRDAVSAAEAMGRAAEEAAKKAKGAGSISPAVKNFRDGAGGNFADIGGAGIPIRTDYKPEVKGINDFTKGIGDQAAAAMGDLNPFKPIMKKFDEFKKWWGGIWPPLVKGTKDMFSSAFDGVSLGIDGKKVSGVFDTVKNMASGVKDFVVEFLKFAGKLWNLFWPNLKKIGENAFDGLKKAWGKIWPELKALGAELSGLKPVFMIIVGYWSLLIKVILSVIEKVIGPAIEAVGGILANIIQIVRGVVQVISGFFLLFTDFPAGIKKIGAGLLNIFSGIFGGIGQLIKGMFRVIVGAVWGIVKGIWDFFYWLWDELLGHSIIPDIINGILFWFNMLITLAKWVWDFVVQPIIWAFGKLFDGIMFALSFLWAGITAAMGPLIGLAGWVWNNILAPAWHAFQKLWGWIKAGFRFYWPGIKAALAGLLNIAKWVWNNVLQPLWSRFQEAWQRIRAALRLWYSGVVSSWNTLKTIGAWVWNNVLKPVWDKFTDAFSKIKGVVGGAKDFIMDKFNAMKDGIGGVVQAFKDAPGKIADLGQKFLNAGKTIVEKIVEGFKSVTGVISGIAGSIWDFLKKTIDDLLLKPLRNALNFSIDWKIFHKDFNFGDAIPHLYTGGIVRGSQAGMLAVLGDRGHDEAVIPLSGPNSPFSRLNSSTGESGFRQNMIGPGGSSTVINIYGNLNFPNMKDGDSVEEFIENLKNIAA